MAGFRTLGLLATFIILSYLSKKTIADDSQRYSKSEDQSNTSSVRGESKKATSDAAASTVANADDKTEATKAANANVEKKPKKEKSRTSMIGSKGTSSGIKEAPKDKRADSAVANTDGNVAASTVAKVDDGKKAKKVKSNGSKVISSGTKGASNDKGADSAVENSDGDKKVKKRKSRTNLPTSTVKRTSSIPKAADSDRETASPVAKKGDDKKSKKTTLKRTQSNGTSSGTKPTSNDKPANTGELKEKSKKTRIKANLTLDTSKLNSNGVKGASGSKRTISEREFKKDPKGDVVPPSPTRKRDPAVVFSATFGDDGKAIEEVNCEDAFKDYKLTVGSQYKATKLATANPKFKTVVDALFTCVKSIFHGTHVFHGDIVDSSDEAVIKFDKCFSTFKTNYKSNVGNGTDADFAQLSDIMKKELRSRIDRLITKNSKYEKQNAKTFRNF